MSAYSLMQSAPGPEAVIDGRRYLYFGGTSYLGLALKTRGIMLPYVNAYAGVPPAGLLRFAVFADHSAAQINRLLAELRTLL